MRVTLPVRYYECDMQRVVHNAVYLAWCDDVGDRLFKDAGGSVEGLDWDVMVKTATLSWSSPARLGDDVAIEAGVSRWGNTSFDVSYSGTVGDREVFESTITYVTVHLASGSPIPVPEDFRRALER